MESLDTNTPKEPKLRDIVCLYSQADESFYLQLKKSLNLWERGGHVRWLEVRPGEELSVTLRDHVKRADLILFLLSSDFFADERCYQTMHLALQEQASRQVPVVPILVRAVNWQLSACKDLAIVPHNEQPIASWTLPDEAYVSIGADLTRLLPAWQLSFPTRPRLFQARDLPKGYVPRPKEFDAIKHLLLNQQDNQTTAITIALRGAGGFGKTTLALALCHNPEIQAAFSDGILWVELGEQPPRPLDTLNGVLASLEPSLSGAITLEEARDRWRTVLDGRVCLLVIDDVWQVSALEPLLEGGPHCMRLVTTRNDLLLPKDATRVLVDVMKRHEALTVLCQNLPGEISQAIYQPKLEALATRMGYWPLLLTLAHGMLTDLVEYGLSIDEALTTVAEAYQTRGVTAFRLDNADERQQTVDACLRVSLQHLEKFTHPHYSATERYQELVVFPEDTDIPLATLQIYWKGSAGLEPWETKDLCTRLYRLSLLLTCDLGKGTIRLHDVVRSYLIQQAGSHLSALHARLLDAYQQLFGLTRWADLPSDEVYLWNYLILHLCQAGRLDAVQATLSDLGYLARKALYMGVSILETDLWLACTCHSAQMAFPLMTDLYRCIVRISHLLRPASTFAEMGGVLLSYLPEELATASQRHVLENELPRPFLVAWHPLPTQASSALRRTLFGHTGWVIGCAVSADGTVVVSASDDDTLKVWDTATGTERLTLSTQSRDTRLSGHTGSFLGCAMSADGSVVVSVSFSTVYSTLQVWDATTGMERLTLGDDASFFRGCAMSADGSVVVSASPLTLQVWDATTGMERLTLRAASILTDCAMSADGSVVISTSYDGTLEVWDATTGTERLTLSGHTGEVNGCAVSADGTVVVSASSDRTLKVWDGTTGTERLTLSGHTDTVNGCAISADGAVVVSASDDHTLKVWDGTTGTERLTLSGHTGEVWDCAISADGTVVVSASADRTLKVWNAITRAELRTPEGHTGFVLGCAVSADGTVVVSASFDHTLKVWDGTTGTERLTLSGHTDTVNGCAISADGAVVVSASDDDTLKVWNAITGAELHTLEGHTGSVLGCAVSTDGTVVVSASADHTLKVWDGTTGTERLTLSGHTDTVNGCAISADGAVVVSASDDHTLKVWNAITGAELRTLEGHTGFVLGCTVSTDGTVVVSASFDDTLKVWDTATGTERLTLSGHISRVLGCAVSADGSVIVSAAWDHTLKVWDGTTGLCLLTFPVDGSLFGCTFYPDEEHLVAYGTQGMYFLQLVK